MAHCKVIGKHSSSSSSLCVILNAEYRNKKLVNAAAWHTHKESEREEERLY